jgi:hypothetical protein
MHRTWLPLIVLVVTSLVGDALTRSNANVVDRERQLQAANDGLRNLPTTIGPWRSIPGEALSEAALRILQCRAHASLSFINDETGERVSLILMAGAAGPMVAHTPESCYESGSFEMVEAARTESISSAGGRTDTFERVTFRPKSGGPALQRIYHAWCRSRGRWEAPRNPRLSLGGEAMLYKLQLATSVPDKPADDSAGSDACRHFLEVLIPALDHTLSNR